MIRPPGRARRPRRGALMLMAAMIGSLLVMFGMAAAVDAARLYLAHRESVNAAEMAALAGALQVPSGRSTIDQTAARRAVEDYMARSSAVGSLRWGAYQPSSLRITTTPDRVTVRFSVVVPTVVGRLFGESDRTLTVTRDATPCSPRQRGGPTQGYCQRPR